MADAKEQIIRISNEVKVLRGEQKRMDKLKEQLKANEIALESQKQGLEDKIHSLDEEKKQLARQIEQTNMQASGQIKLSIDNEKKIADLDRALGELEEEIKNLKSSK